MPRLTLKKVNEAIQAKWPGVELVRGRGEGYQYYYVSATLTNDYGMGLKIAMLNQTTITGASKIAELNIPQWIESVEYVLLDKYELNPYSRNPAI